MQKHSMFIHNEGGRRIDYYLASDVDALLQQIKAELDMDDLTIAKDIVNRSLARSYAEVHDL